MPLPLSIESALVALEGLLGVALALHGDAAPRPGTGVLAIDVEGGVEVLDGLVVLVRRHQALAAGRIGRAHEGVAVDGGVEVEDRLLVHALALVEQAAGMQAPPPIPAEGGSRVQVVEGFLELVLGAQRLPRPI